MAKWVSVNRYRMVDLRSGRIVVVFQLYPQVKPLESCRLACDELGVELDAGHYRLDSLKQDAETKVYRWSRVYRFSLEVNG